MSRGLPWSLKVIAELEGDRPSRTMSVPELDRVKAQATKIGPGISPGIRLKLCLHRAHLTNPSESIIMLLVTALSMNRDSN